MSEKFDKDTTVGQKHLVPCSGSCAGKTEHAVIRSIEKSGSDAFISWWIDHQIVQCQGCKTVSFRYSAGSDNDYVQVAEDEWEFQGKEVLYPSRLEGRKGLGDEMFYLPSTVRSMYEETLSALTNSLPILTGIGLRALIEAVCKAQHAQGANLYTKIDDLAKKGVLTQNGGKILHKIRDLGNNAAHEARPHTVMQLRLALDVVEHMLREVYILPAQVEEEFNFGASPDN